MNEAAIRKRLIELGRAMTGLPSSGAAGTDEDRPYPCDAPEDKQTFEELMDGLRVHLKYLLFDLEATRRENRYLRRMLKMLDTRPRPSADEDRGDPSG